MDDILPLQRVAALRRTLAALCVVMMGALLAGCGFNTIPTREEQAKASWAEVQNQYQRRADLVPNLVETVKGYASHERETLQAVVDARARATQTQISGDALNNPELMQQYMQNQAGLSSALSRLMVVVERYPDLKANQNFLALQSQLEGTENRIAVARRDYIDHVRVYNTALRTMPTMIWKWLWYKDAKPLPAFETAPENSQPPKVEFNR